MGLIISKLLGARWKFTTFVGRKLLRQCGVQLGSDIRFLGLPIISGAHLGRIEIRDRVSLVSNSRGTALGVRGPTILRLLAPGAALAIGPDTGLSGVVICAAVSVKIGARCLIGADVMIFDTDFHNVEAEDRRYSKVMWPEISASVTIGDNVFIGSRAIVLKGVSIGDGAVIGANSVVTSDIPANVVAAGNPARVVRTIGDTKDSP